MLSHTYVVKRFGLASLARWGFAAGSLVACLPGLICSAMFFSITAAVYHTVESWRDVGLTIIGQRFSLDLVQLLQLQSFSAALGATQAVGVFGILLLALAFALAIGLVVGLSLVLLGAIYNLTGRLKIELVAE